MNWFTLFKLDFLIVFGVLLEEIGEIGGQRGGNGVIIEGPRETSSIIIADIEEENVEVIFTNGGDILRG